MSRVLKPGCDPEGFIAKKSTKLKTYHFIWSAMKIFGWSAFVVLIVGALSGVSHPDDGGWRKIAEENGIVGYVRPTPRSSVDEIKAIGIVDAPLAAVEAVIRDVSLMPQYVFLCRKSFLIDTPEMKSRGDVMYFYNRMDLPFPASDRDVVMKARWSIDKKTGTVHCRAENVPTDCLKDKDAIRIPLSLMTCALSPQGRDSTKVIYHALVDPGGELPSLIVNMLTRDYGVKTIAGLREMVKKEPFKNAKKVITSTPEENLPSVLR